MDIYDIICQVMSHLNMNEIVLCTTVNKLFYRAGNIDIQYEKFLWDLTKMDNIDYRTEFYATSYKHACMIARQLKSLLSMNAYYNRYRLSNYFISLPDNVNLYYPRQTHRINIIDLYNAHTLAIIYDVDKIMDRILILNQLQKISIINLSCDMIPMNILKLTNLKYLDLDRNKFVSIPTEISNLVNLKILNLSFNKITSIPSEIGNLVQLQELALHYNQIVSVPNEIIRLTNLKKICLSHNMITSMPSNTRDYIFI